MVKLDFKLEMRCGCSKPVCEHAGAGIARLLQAAYEKGVTDGRAARKRVAAAASPRPAKRPPASQEAPEAPAARLRQKGSRRTQ